MAESLRFSAFTVVFPALTALAGAAVGSLMAGSYQLEAQQMAITQAENLERYQANRQLGEVLADKVAHYNAALMILTLDAAAPQADAKVIEEHLVEYNLASQQVVVRSSRETAAIVLNTNMYMAGVLQNRLRGGPSVDPTKDSTLIKDVFGALYLEVMRYRRDGLPAGKGDDLSKLLDSWSRSLPRP